MTEDKRDNPEATPDSNESKASLDADLEPSTVKDQAQDERLEILTENPLIEQRKQCGS
jgi:hypothetical protein